MTTKLLAFFAVSSLVLLAQAVSFEDAEYQQPDVLYIVGFDVNPVIPAESIKTMMEGGRNTVCTAALCQSVSHALNYKFGRCNANNVCVCSNY